MRSTAPVHRPAPLSAALAVAAALLPVVLVAAGRPTLVAAVEAGGVVALGVGAAGYRRGWTLLGGATSLAGAGVVVGAIGWGSVTAGALPDVLVAAPGYLGPAVLALGVLPLRGSGSRWFVRIGAGVALLCVLVAGVLDSPATWRLFVGTVASVVAWDLGENAIGLGEQLGRETPTARVEAVHALGTVGAGLVGIQAIRLVQGWNPGDVSLSSLLLLVVAVIALTAALHD